MTEDSLALTRLLQLASPLLPVGAFSYSQGLESAVADGSVCDAATVRRWVLDCLELGLARFEAPIVLRLQAAWTARDGNRVRYWNTRYLASRESAELHAETVQMGYSLRRLLVDLGAESGADGCRLRDPDLAALQEIDSLSYPASFAFAAALWEIEPKDALTAYLWSWTENQVSSAMKAIPLGQVAGQRILVAAQPVLSRSVAKAERITDDELANLLPAVAIASARHETQYSRLFRS
jgi:urease accessory protein